MTASAGAPSRHSTDAAVARAQSRAAEAIAAARAAPLSRKKARLAALLVDAWVDAGFAAESAPAADILAYRDALAAKHPALALIFALTAENAQLSIETITIPIENYDTLSLEDFMVSIYNANTVQRLMLVMADGSKHDVHGVLARAMTP